MIKKEFHLLISLIEIKNINFEFLDILKFNKKFVNQYDGLVSIHALCCFKSLDKVIKICVK